MNSSPHTRSHKQTFTDISASSRVGSQRDKFAYGASIKPIYANGADLANMLCCYHNASSTIQIIRSTSFEIPEWYLERVIFPGQRLLFYAPKAVSLQIFTSSIVGSILSDTIPCDRLQVDEG